MKVAIYARVSTKDKGQETENQVTPWREFAAKQGWDIYHEYIDHASGSTDARLEFQRMFEDARMRKFDVLLFWSLDRLSREGVLETLQHLNRLTSYGVAWRSFTEQYLDSTGVFKDAVISILAVVAKQERIRISERTKAGLDIARSKGKRLGRPVVAVDLSKVRSLRASGLSYAAISRELGVSTGTVHHVATRL